MKTQTKMDWGLVDGLFRRYSRVVYRRAHAILRDKDAAEDATQEVFLRAMRSADQLARVESPPVWLGRITTNLCLNRLRDAARRRRLLMGSAHTVEPVAEPRADAQLTVQAIMRSVPEPLQVIAVHYFVDEMSQDEISALLGVPRKAVRYRLEKVRTAALSV
jgi:RNA polymerase sigma-70 factor (ECF subfamily)